MTYGRPSRWTLGAPRLVTFAISLLLVLAAVASLRVHLPVGASFVAAHRFWIVVAGYGILVLGVVLPSL